MRLPSPVKANPAYRLVGRYSGIGNVANSIIGGLADGPFQNVQVGTLLGKRTAVKVCSQLWHRCGRRFSKIPSLSSWTVERCVYQSLLPGYHQLSTLLHSWTSQLRLRYAPTFSLEFQSGSERPLTADSIQSGRLRPLLRELGPVQGPSPASLAAGGELSRDHQAAGSHRNE